MYLFPLYAGTSPISKIIKHNIFHIDQFQFNAHLKCGFLRRHWSLLILCHFGESLESETSTPCMLLLDSLEMTNPKRLEPDIRKYVSSTSLNFSCCSSKLELYILDSGITRFVMDIYKEEGRPYQKEAIEKIPLLVPKVNLM